MKTDAFKSLSPEGQILALELMEVKKILVELRDGVRDLETEATDGSNKSEGHPRSEETKAIPSTAVGVDIRSLSDGKRGG